MKINNLHTMKISENKIIALPAPAIAMAVLD